MVILKSLRAIFETVSISVINAGTSELRIIGKGAILASVSFPFQLRNRPRNGL